MPFLVMSEELGRHPRATNLLRKTRPSLVIVSLLAFAAIFATVAVACDDTGPSPIGEHFDDAGPDTADAPEPEDGGGEGGEGGGEGGAEGGSDGGTDGGSDAADASDGD